MARVTALSRHANRPLARTYAGDARPRNEDIPFKYVKLVDPQTGHLTQSIPLIDVLNSRERNEKNVHLNAVELVSFKPDPIVKFINLKDEYVKKRAQQRKHAESSKARKEKEVQMTWQVAGGDMGHKLQKARDALLAGQRVVVAYTSKKGQTRLTPEEMKAKLDETLQRLQDVGQPAKPPALQPPTTGFVWLKPLSSS